MNDEKNTKGKHIKGITCDVTNCAYHGKENCCHADSIAVGPSYAQSSSETVCATLSQRKIAIAKNSRLHSQAYILRVCK